jgi:hypothetical protein
MMLYFTVSSLTPCVTVTSLHDSSLAIYFKTRIKNCCNFFRMMACKGVAIIGYFHQPVCTKLQTFSGYTSHGFFPQPKFNFNNSFKLRKVSHVEGCNSRWNPSFLSFSVPQFEGNSILPFLPIISYYISFKILWYELNLTPLQNHGSKRRIVLYKSSHRDHEVLGNKSTPEQPASRRSAAIPIETVKIDFRDEPITQVSSIGTKKKKLFFEHLRE